MGATFGPDASWHSVLSAALLCSIKPNVFKFPQKKEIVDDVLLMKNRKNKSSVYISYKCALII